MRTLIPTLMTTLMANNNNVDINDIITLMTTLMTTEFFMAVHYWCNRIFYSRSLLMCHKPPINVPYKHTFGVPDQGQTLDVWESQTTESALRWLAPYRSKSYSWSCSWSYSWSYSWTHVLGINTMTSLILDHVAIDYLYLGTSTERKICSWSRPRTRLW